MELLTHLWHEMGPGQQEEQRSQSNSVAFHCGVFSPHFVQCLCRIFGNEFLQPDGRPQAQGRGRLCSPHLTRQTAKCKVTVEWLRREGEETGGGGRKAGKLLS